MEEVRPIFAPRNLFWVWSVVSPLESIENLWENPPSRENAYDVVCLPKGTKLKKIEAACRRTNAENFVKIV